MIGKHRSANVTGSSGPHPFVEPPDPRLGLSLGASQGGVGGPMAPAGAFLVAGATIRPVRCAARGCGKLRDDPIHWPSD